MRLAALVIVLALALPGVAVAKRPGVAPPGNSGVHQYVETLPTANGNRPTSTLPSAGHQPTGPVVGGPEGGSGAGGGSGLGGGQATPAIPPGAQRALSAKGPTGRAAARLLQETAAATPPHRQIQAATAGASGASAARSVAGALLGSGSAGGLGPLLPVVLIVAAVVLGAIAILRRRHAN